MSTYRNYYSSSSDGIGASKYSSLGSSYRPSYSLSTGSYRSKPATTTPSTLVSTYVSRFSSFQSDKDKDKTKAKERETENFLDKTKDSYTEMAKFDKDEHNETEFDKPKATIRRSALIAAKYGTNKDSDATDDSKSKTVTKPKKDSAPPVTFTTRYGRAGLATNKDKTRDPSPSTKTTVTRTRDASPATKTITDSLPSMGSMTRTRVREPSPATKSVTDSISSTSSLTRIRNRDASPMTKAATDSVPTGSLTRIRTRDSSTVTKAATDSLPSTGSLTRIRTRDASPVTKTVTDSMASTGSLTRRRTYDLNNLDSNSQKNAETTSPIRTRTRDISNIAKSLSNTTHVTPNRRVRAREPSPAVRSRDPSPVNHSVTHQSAFTPVTSRARSREPSPAEMRFTQELKRAIDAVRQEQINNMSREPSPINFPALSVSSKIRSRDPSPADTSRMSFSRSLSNAIESLENRSRLRSRDPSPVDGTRVSISRSLSNTRDSIENISRLRSRDPSPAEVTRVPYSRSLSNNKDTLENRRSSITQLNRPKLREPSPSFGKVRTRDPSPASELSNVRMRRTSRDTSPPGPPVTYKNYMKGNSVSTKTTSQNLQTPKSPIVEMALSYLSSNESKLSQENRHSRVSSYDSSEKAQSTIISTPSPIPSETIESTINPEIDEKKEKTSSSEETTESTASSEETSETESEELRAPEPKIMIEITIVNRGTSPNPPGATPSLIRMRRLNDISKTVERTVQKPLSTALTLDKSIQSDRMDDTSRYSRFGSTTRSPTTYSSYLDNRFSQSPSRYSTTSSRYSTGKDSSTSREPSVSSSKSDIPEKKEEKMSALAARVKEISLAKANAAKPIRTSPIKQRSPIKQKSPEKPPPIPTKADTLSKKSDSPIKSISASSTGNKDFRKSALNMGPADRPRKSPQKMISQSSSSSHENGDSTLSRSAHDTSPPRRTERSPSVCSESSSSSCLSKSSSSSSASDSNINSRTSQMISTTEELPYDKTPITMHSSPRNNDLLMRVFQSAASYFKNSNNNKSNKKAFETDTKSSLSESINLETTKDTTKMDEQSETSENKTQAILTFGPSNEFQYKIKKNEPLDNGWWMEKEKSEHKNDPSIQEEEETEESSTTSRSSSEEKEIIGLKNELSKSKAAFQVNQVQENVKTKSLTGSESSTETSSSSGKVESVTKPIEGVLQIIPPVKYADDESYQPKKMYRIQHIESGEKAWWMQSNHSISQKANEELKKNSPKALSPETRPNYKIRPVESGERAWWLQSNSSINEKSKEVLKELTSPKALSPENTQSYRIRPVESGERAWWLQSNSNINEKAMEDLKITSPKALSKASSPEASSTMYKIRPVESGEKAWWMQSNGNINDKLDDESPIIFSPENAPTYRIRPVESGEKEWWLKGNTNINKKSKGSSKSSTSDSTEGSTQSSPKALSPEATHNYQIQSMESQERNWSKTNDKTEFEEEEEPKPKVFSPGEAPIYRIRPVESGERAWWLQSSSDIHAETEREIRPKEMSPEDLNIVNKPLLKLKNSENNDKPWMWQNNQIISGKAREIIEENENGIIQRIRESKSSSSVKSKSRSKSKEMSEKSKSLSKILSDRQKISSKYDKVQADELDTDNDIADELEEIDNIIKRSLTKTNEYSEKSKSLSSKLSNSEKKLSSRYDNVPINAEYDTDNDIIDQLDEIEASNVALKFLRKSISEKSNSSKKLSYGDKKVSSKYDNVQISEQDTDNDILDELDIEVKGSARKSLSEKSKSLSRILSNGEKKLSSKHENIQQNDMDTDNDMADPLEDIILLKSSRKSISEKSKSLSKRSMQKSKSISKYDNLQENKELDTDNDIADDLEDIEVAKVARLPKFPVNNEEPMETNPSPLGDRASPEGIEDIKPIIESKRNSIYDNIPLVDEPEKIDFNNFKTPTQLFISRHTNIDDLLGGSCHPMSPVMDRNFVVEDLKEPEADVFNVQQIEETFICESSSPRKGSVAMEISADNEEETSVKTNSVGVLNDVERKKSLDDATVQVYKDGDFGAYLDMESSLAEQTEEIEGVASSRKNSLVVRTQLSVRVHSIIEKLLSSEGRELRRALFSLKQIFQEDKDLVHGFVALGGLNCLVQIGNNADQNYQNYILRALGQVMLYVDGMNGVMKHEPTIQWLYSLISSKYRLVVKTALKLLLVFVEYCEENCYVLVNAIKAVDTSRGMLPWSNIMKLLKDYENADTELLIYAVTLVNKTLSGLSDQDTFYDESDYLEQQNMEGIVQRYMSRQGTDLDLLDQLQLYETVLRFEDGETDNIRIPDNTVRKTLRYRSNESSDRRKSRRHSTYTSVKSSVVTSPPPPPPPPLPPFPLFTSILPPVPPLPQNYNPSANQAQDEDSSSSAHSGDINMNGSGVFNNGPRETAGVTPGLRRRRERAERQKSFMREQQELFINGTTKPTEDSEVEEENEDKKLLLQLKKDHTVKDLTQKLTNMPLSPQEEKPQSRIGDMSGLISKAKEELEKSKSNKDIPKQNPETEIKKVIEPKKSENELQWEELQKNMTRKLELCDLDFTDLTQDDDKDVLTPRGFGGAIPPPPPCLPPIPMLVGGLLQPPPPPTNLVPPPMMMMNGPLKQIVNGNLENQSSIVKNKKTVKLFWKEVREDMIPPNVGCTIWDELPEAHVDTEKLEHLFESRAKDLMTKEKQQDLNKNKEIIVLDHKRSNAINIAMTKLPPPRAIKAAILKMDSTVVTREGVDKLLNLLPSDEERGKILEAQIMNFNDLPLGSAEQFLLTLSSICELGARLKLWAFKLDFENIEKEIAEPLMDLKQGIEVLKSNQTFKCILSTLLKIGIFLNGAPVKGFQIEYLAKVPEVKDTVHKHSLLHHLCHMVMESKENTTDLYSEIGPITRASKTDFDELAKNIRYLETECKASWDRLRLISKHDTPPQLKQKLIDFLGDCAERIIILDIVHRRIMNRYRKFLLWLGVPQHRIAESKPNDFCRILSEFALEYRTTRERVQQQIEKKANHRERNKTRGKMIIDVAKLKTQTQSQSHSQSQSKEDKADAELRQLLGTPTKEDVEMSGTLTWRRRRGADNKMAPSIVSANENFMDGDDEILETLVKTATKTPSSRNAPRERKRTRHADRKSYKRSRTREGFTMERRGNSPV